MEIRLEDHDKKGRAVAIDSSSEIAEMTYSKAGTKQIIINHTEVDEGRRGESIGRKLLDVIVEYARKNEKKIIPLCPYAKSEFDKDTTISDVLRPFRIKN